MIFMGFYGRPLVYQWDIHSLPGSLPSAKEAMI